VAGVFTLGHPAGQTERLTVAQVHEHHADFVFRTLQRLGVRDRDLEDALQEVFIVVHRKLSTFDGSARLTTWLYGIALRVAAAQRRRAHLRREEPMADPAQETSSSDEDDPERQYLAREARERLSRALDSLTLDKRAVFVMFEIEGLAAIEIADMVGVPVGTVHSRLSAARTEFAAAVERMNRREQSRERK
jgi:RNA polymerase sigma-70 factor (ECF subfamily)